MNDNWIRVSLEQACSLVTDGTHHSPPNGATGEFKYVTAKNIRKHGLDLTDITYVLRGTHEEIFRRCPVEQGDVLYIKDGVTTGLAAVNHLAEPFSLLSSVALLKPRRDVLVPAYLKHWLNSPSTVSAMIGNMTGSAIKRLVLKQIRAAEIPLPPLAEQQRIADKLDAILARVDACRERLDSVKDGLRRFRDGVLGLAMSGKLTADWRDRTKVSASWASVRISEVGHARLGKMLDHAKNAGDPKPYLRNINVRWFGFDLTDVQEIRVSPTEVTELTLRPGDLLICEGGEPGRCAVWRTDRTDVVFQKALHRVRLQPDLCLPEWLAYCLRWSAISGALAKHFTGSTIKHLTGAGLVAWEFPLPPISEQREAVQRVVRLLNLVEALELRCAGAVAKVECLAPAVLAKAFRGELVPQDPADEPAEALLSRLAAKPTEIHQRRRGAQIA